ncbi:MAG: substrate-binding domain-containing protein [Phenylobacterium sp.]|uniref:substrate-binding domain-containing protein n=1 Tax=Phenylobacterium sp. TaxID=1871053 RepID=UPI001B7024B4|nr:substrate-binding domain-containing protein [Phenylobacterium sp.]MBP7648368.1 substrate-binding domain-containing protein [Phenylobacterium sp.]MBP7816476.1 substrate-binding domain-containing protein [Phenylobacterium sp.]MBP9231090.1 substrate-binding domain-containing protein [Phenylobacterium sp.]MBP9754757.1 substrate-binding domain-containing protein [Phenylobacterium sp.]
MKTVQVKTLLGCVAAAALLGAGAPAWAARDYVWAAGSSTVFPFSTRVAENYARKTGKKAPKVESLGTGGGIKLFCGGVGDAFPDIANASRPMKKSEFDACVAKGVKDIVQIKIGFDGIVVATDKDGADYNFKTEHLYLGLSANVLRQGKFVKNPYTTWDEIGAGLPGNRIQVYGPPPTSGTRDAWVELAIEAGARKYPTADELRSNNEKKFKELVDPMRKDGWIDAGENDNAIVGTLTKTPGSLGVFGWSYLEENMDKIKGASINGVKPSAGSISDGSYPLARSLYIYVKKSHIGVTQGLQDYLNEFVSDAATGRGGYLQSRGLIPLPAGQHDGQQAAAQKLTPMARPAS